MGRWLRVSSLRPTGRDQAPLETKFAADPVGLLFRSLGDTGPGEAAAIQLLFTVASRRARTRLLSDAARLRSGKRRRSPIEFAFEARLFLLCALWEVVDRTPTHSGSSYQPAPQPAVLLERDRVQALTEKAREPLFACSLRLGAVAPTRGLARGLLGDLRAGYEQYDALNGLNARREPVTPGVAHSRAPICA